MPFRFMESSSGLSENFMASFSFIKSFLTNSTRLMLKVCIPSSFPAVMAFGIFLISFSRMSAEMAGELYMISMAATRPFPSDEGISRCATVYFN